MGKRGSPGARPRSRRRCRGLALTKTTEAITSSDIAEVIPGQLDVDEVLDLVVRDDQPPAPAALTGEVVAPAGELVKAFAATLVARPQTQRTCERACKRFARWLVGIWNS